ncbi:hypothetical protein [Qipengyuania oceanensis]|uniref:Uncharacterized protein n=1 Tax=Qipengyuania oceanensis TaxID=1463597 RepID=A0A844YGL3_9SPHN|nr:hypothetical protein [Qipengyuania oceanensis]MXO62823.1 hypothetical protein [Qipengyuania oceanensis]
MTRAKWIIAAVASMWAGFASYILIDGSDGPAWGARAILFFIAALFLIWGGRKYLVPMDLRAKWHEAVAQFPRAKGTEK